MWDFQEPPTAGPSGDWKFWTAAGRDTRGAKTEHNSPDPRGNSRYIQGSTAGYMGIYDLTGADSLSAKLAGLAAGVCPTCGDVLCCAVLRAVPRDVLCARRPALQG